MACYAIILKCAGNRRGQLWGWNPLKPQSDQELICNLCCLNFSLVEKLTQPPSKAPSRACACALNLSIKKIILQEYLMYTLGNIGRLRAKVFYQLLIDFHIIVSLFGFHSYQNYSNLCKKHVFELVFLLLFIGEV